MMKYKPAQISKASRRRAHFAAGLSPAMWRGRSSRDLDASSSKARKNKLRCREKIRPSADA